MADEAKAWWEANAREFQAMAQLPIAVIYGTHVTEEKLQLIGPVAGKQLLEIGCGGAQCGIAFAKQGALVTGVDIAAAQLAIARELAAQNGVSITFHQRDMTDLTPIASASQDIVFSSIAFHYVDDIGTCFQEVYRVLKAQGLFVFSIEHPFSAMIDGGTMLPDRAYFDTGKVVLGLEVSDEVGYAFAENRRTVSDFFSALVGAGFVVEQLIEPDVRPVDPTDPKNQRWGKTPQFLETFPGILIFKSRKQQARVIGEVRWAVPRYTYCQSHPSQDRSAVVAFFEAGNYPGLTLTSEIYAGEGHGSEGIALTYLHGLRKLYPPAAGEQRDEEAG